MDNEENKTENGKVENEFEFGTESKFKMYLSQYGGAIVGGIVALLLLATGIYKLLVGIIVLVLSMLLGNYIQKNKQTVKEKLKNFIDMF